MRTITCKIPAEMDAQLTMLARQQRISKSAFVRNALEKQLKLGSKKKKQMTAYDRIAHLCGVIKGGPRDLSTNPKYMEGFGAD